MPVTRTVPESNLRSKSQYLRRAGRITIATVGDVWAGGAGGIRAEMDFMDFSLDLFKSKVDLKANYVNIGKCFRTKKPEDLDKSHDFKAVVRSKMRMRHRWFWNCTSTVV